MAHCLFQSVHDPSAFTSSSTLPPVTSVQQRTNIQQLLQAHLRFAGLQSRSAFDTLSHTGRTEPLMGLSQHSPHSHRPRLKTEKERPLATIFTKHI